MQLNPSVAVLRVFALSLLCTLCEPVTSNETEPQATPPLRVEIHLPKHVVTEKDFLVVEVKFINDSRQGISCFNSALSPLLADRVAFLNLLDADGVCQLDILERNTGSFISPRLADWREIPPGGIVSKTIVVPTRKVFRTADGKHAYGHYALQLDVYSGMLGKAPWSAEDKAMDSEDPLGLRVWQKSLPGTIVVRSKKAYFEFVPTK